jgi:hypothetical protein
MYTDFRELMSNKTDAELMEYITNIDRYSHEALVAVVNELKVRGHNFPDEELRSINEKIQIKKEVEEEDGFFRSSKSLRKNVVTDPNAPLLYSKVAIMTFSILFTVIFGSILLSFNIANTGKKLKVIGFGLLLTILATVIGNLLPHSILYVYLINCVGGYFLTSDFWNNNIGRETKYRSRPIWLPLIISILIAVLLLIVAVYKK